MDLSNLFGDGISAVSADQSSNDTMPTWNNQSLADNMFPTNPSPDLSSGLYGTSNNDVSNLMGFAPSSDIGSFGQPGYTSTSDPSNPTVDAFLKSIASDSSGSNVGNVLSSLLGKGGLSNLSSLIGVAASARNMLGKQPSQMHLVSDLASKEHPFWGANIASPSMAPQIAHADLQPSYIQSGREGDQIKNAFETSPEYASLHSGPLSKVK